VDWNILLSPILNQLQLEHVCRVFIEDVGEIDPQAFLDWLTPLTPESFDNSPFPKSWPPQLKAAASYEPLEQLAQQAYHNTPIARRNQQSLELIVTNLAKALILAGYKQQSQSIKPE
jgi:hypothetical protein